MDDGCSPLHHHPSCFFRDHCFSRFPRCPILPLHRHPPFSHAPLKADERLESLEPESPQMDHLGTTCTTPIKQVDKNVLPTFSESPRPRFYIIIIPQKSQPIGKFDYTKKYCGMETPPSPLHSLFSQLRFQRCFSQTRLSKNISTRYSQVSSRHSCHNRAGTGDQVVL